MNQSKTPPISVIDIRAHEYSADGRAIMISLATKYSAERRTYSVPVECLHTLIADLRTLKRPSEAGAATDGGELATAEAASSPGPVADTTTSPAQAKDLTRLNVTVPKKWLLRSGLPDHPLVVMVFDPLTEKQSGYGLTVTAAREMAVALVKYADTVTKHQASQPKQQPKQQPKPN
jgi:hypothetical protein